MPRASDSAVPGSVQAWQCVICCWIKSCCKNKAQFLETVADVHSPKAQVEPLTTLIRDEPEDPSCPSASWFQREGPEWFKKTKIIFNHPKQLDQFSGYRKSNLSVNKLHKKVPVLWFWLTECCQEFFAASRSFVPVTQNKHFKVKKANLGELGHAGDLSGRYLRTERQGFVVEWVNDGRVRLKDDAFAWRLKRSSAHGHQQVGHLEVNTDT